jgi:hypothetical protein
MKRGYIITGIGFFLLLSVIPMKKGVKKNHAPVREQTQLQPETKSAKVELFPSLKKGTDAKAGARHLLEIYSKAADMLRARKVMSLAFPDENVADVIAPDILASLPIVEHIDPAKIRRDGSRAAVQDVLSNIGRTKGRAYKQVQSYAGAKGLWQYMPRTYRGIRKKYPDAQLIPSFTLGMSNQVNAAMAAFLLLDESLSGVKKSQREILRQSPGALRNYLAAAYNAGFPKAASALRTDKKKIFLERGNLPGQTRGYLKKFKKVHPEVTG